MRATLTEKIKKFEEREKEFFEQIKQVDEKNDSKTKEVLAKLKEIENNAKKSFEVKDQIQKYKSSETETKFKIAIYSQRFGDFESTLGTTNDMLSRFKQELERVIFNTYYSNYARPLQDWRPSKLRIKPLRKRSIKSIQLPLRYSTW